MDRPGQQPGTRREPAQAKRPRWARVNLALLLLAAWLIGSAAMINTVVNRARSHALPEWAHIRSWAMVFAVIFGMGLLRGAFDYGIGGLWVRLKLWICGVHGGQWGTSTRLFCFPRLPEQLASLGLLVYLSFKYDDLPAFIAQPVGVGNLLPAAVMLATPFLTYFAARSAYTRLRPVWTAVLFFVLPMLWRAGVVLVLLTNLLFPGLIPALAPRPDVEHPAHYSSSSFELDYPGNWRVIDSDPVDGRIELRAGRGSAVLTIWAAPIDGPYVAEMSLGELSEQGYTAQLVDEQEEVTLGSQTGYGLEYKLTRNGERARMFHFIMQLNADELAIFRYRANPRDWEVGQLGPMQVVDSIALKGFNNMPPDLEHTELIERDGFSCRVPGNWEMTDQSHTKYQSFVVSPPQGGRFWCSIFDRPITPQKELDAYIEFSLWHETIEQRGKLDSFFGLTGVGVDLVCREPLLGMQRVRAVYVPLKDGRVIGIRVEQPESSAATTDAGFDLIGRTFELGGVEPASP